MVCRAFHQSPDDIRAWEYADYLEAVEQLKRVPLLDEVVFRFFAGSGKKQATVPLDEKNRIEFIKKLSKRDQSGS
jgi:hypothetical protein